MRRGSWQRAWILLALACPSLAAASPLTGGAVGLTHVVPEPPTALLMAAGLAALLLMGRRFRR